MSQEESSEAFRARIREALKVKLRQSQDIPDSSTEVGVHQFDAAGEKAKADIRKDELRNANFEQNIIQRRGYATKIFYLIVSWLSFVGFIVLLQGFGGNGENPKFDLGMGVLITLITTTTASVIGLFVIVLHYLFHWHSEPPPN